ncbi:MAG: outer membrane protein assembly factor BamD [Opitutales bacterium]
MLSSLVRRLPFCLLLAAFALALPARLAADLVWSPDTGWRIEGGILSGLTGAEGRNALDLMNQAREDEEHGKLHAALKAYGKVIKKYGNSIYTPEALYRSARIYFQRKQYTKSFDSYSEIIHRYPNSKRFNEIIGEQYRIASAMVDGARIYFWGVIPGLPDRTKGIFYLEVLLQEAPYSDYAPLALMTIARGHQLLSDKEEAIDALDRMINQYPQSLLTPDAYLKLAQAHADLVDGPLYDQESTQEAITYFQDFMILYPGDPNIAEAEAGLTHMRTVLAESKVKIADFYFFKRDNYTAARVFYNEAITVYPDSDVAKVARQRLTEVEAAVAAHKAGADAPQSKKKKHFFFF